MDKEIQMNNAQDIKFLQKKYRNKFAFLTNILPLFKQRKVDQKFSRIPSRFMQTFNQKSYLAANPDVKVKIEEKEFCCALEHFILYGYEEVEKGIRQIGIDIPLVQEEIYLKFNPDVKNAIEKGEFSSVFEHFIFYGYQEFLEGKRKTIGVYPPIKSKILEKYIAEYFDEKNYLEVNDDVKKAIENGKISSASKHFMMHGAEEVRRGDRKIHSDIPFFIESLYAEQKDIFDPEKYNDILTPFEHFLLYGIDEIMKGKRVLSEEHAYQYVEPKYTKEHEEKIRNFKYKPLISVVMPVYNVDPRWLNLAIESLKKQWYTNWELCIADDASTKQEIIDFLKSVNDERINIIYLKNNVNISAASNAALSLANGDYIALMDNDDELTPNAFYEVVKTINERGSEFIYSDEDKIEMNGTFSDPHFKPDFSPDMFLSQNYISHLGVIKKELIEQVCGWEIGLEGSQDYDLYLKVLEHTDHIYHIPKVLYHWRKVPGSTAAEYSDKSYAKEAGRKALQNAMKRRNIQATVKHGRYPGTYKIEYDLNEEPLVSIIIPFKDKPELLKMSIESVLNKSTYKNYEIIGMSNNSEEQETFDEMRRLEALDERVKFYEYNEPFNYSAINNYAVKRYANGKHVILMNNDIEIITPQWIEEMLMFSQREDIGVVGAKLYYPDDTIQHAGIIIGLLTLAGHSFKHHSRHIPAYMGRESVVQNISAVTGALLMIKKSIYGKVKGLDEENLKIAFNDVDFCLKVQHQGYLNIFTPWTEAYHHESVSRGLEDTEEKQKRFRQEINFMQNQWKNILEEGDPFYNPNLCLDNEDFSIKKLNFRL